MAFSDKIALLQAIDQYARDLHPGVVQVSASLAADRGPSVCLRFLSRDAESGPATLDGLGYRADQVARFERVLKSEGGALVFAGTVGSGKSTTLATLIRTLPAHRKIITLEEPVEYRIDRAVQNTIGRDLDQQAHGRYAAKLRTLKRSAMTDVLLGEIRDAESGLAFMDLAGSGVNVYTTVHAPSARAIVDRLASDFIAVPRDFETRFKPLLDHPERTNKKLKLLWIGCGRQDSAFERNQKLSELLTAHQVKNTFHATEGLHNFAIWRRYLIKVAPLLFH